MIVFAILLKNSHNALNSIVKTYDRIWLFILTNLGKLGFSDLKIVTGQNLDNFTTVIFKFLTFFDNGEIFLLITTP